MKIESLKVRNYKVFKDIEIKDIPKLAVFLGRNGVGKSTFFDIFGFIHDCLDSNVRVALTKRGGFKEVVSRDQDGDIEFVIQFRQAPDEPLITYELIIGLDVADRPIVKKESLRLRRGKSGAPWKILDFSNGEGVAATGKLHNYEDVQLSTRAKQKLDSADILAIKGLGQFKEFESVLAFRKLIEDWYVADFRVDLARDRQESSYSEQLTRNGENLAAVTQFIFENYPDVFEKIKEDMKNSVPGISYVDAKETEDGYIILRFQDGKFKNPFSAKYVSDGTIKIFTYLVLLNDPIQHDLVCIEEPENQLYPELLAPLAEQFRKYTLQDRQVFISTHSPDFLNSTELDEVFVIDKVDGFSTINRLNKNSLVKALYEGGDLLGYLWKQGLLTGGF